MNDIDSILAGLEPSTAEGADVQLDPLDTLMQQIEPAPEKSLMEQAQDFIQPYQDIYNKRISEVAEAAKRYKSGEEGLGGMLYEAIGSGVGGTIADVQGEIMSNFMPQSVEEAMAKMVQMGLDTDTGKYLIENYNNLSDSTKRKVDATFNLAAIAPSFIASSGKFGTLNKAQRVKRNRLSDLISPRETPDVRKGEALRRFKPVKRHEQDVDLLMEVKGLSPNKSLRSNIKLIDDSQNKLENKLMNQLRSKPIHIKSVDIEAGLKKELNDLINKHDWLQADETIQKNMELQVQKMMSMIRRKGTTPEGMILARREFDKKLKDAMLQKNVAPEYLSAADAVSRSIRRYANKVAHDSLIKRGVDVQGSLDMSSAMFRAVDNLSDKYAFEKPPLHASMTFMRQHPFLTATATSSLAGNQLFGIPLDSPAILGAATVGPVAYGAYRYAPQALKGMDAMMRAGMLSAPAAMGYGAPEEQ